LISFLKLLLSDDCGNPSSIRAAACGTTLIVVAVWGYISIRTLVMVVPSPEMIGLVVSLWGIKTWQKGKEACVDPKTIPSNG